MSRRKAVRFGRASALWCALGWAAWAVFSWAADPLPVPANRQPALLWNVPGEVLEIRAGERATLIVEAADPDTDASGRPEAAQVRAEWAPGAGGGEAPMWSAEPHWTAGPSVEPRLLLTLSPPAEARPGRHTLLVGATDARGLTALRTLSVEVLSADASGGAGGVSGGAGASGGDAAPGGAGSAGPSASAAGGAAGSPDARPMAATPEGELRWDGPVPVHVVERGAGGVSGQSPPGWSVSLSLNDTAGGGTLFSDGYLTAAERAAGGGAGVVRVRLEIDDLDNFSGISFGYVKAASDPGACAAATGTYGTSAAAGLKFSDFTSDGPYFVCLRAGDGAATAYAGPAGFTVDTAAPALGNATYTLPDPANARHAGRLAHTVGGAAALDGALSVFVKGPHAYVASSESGALEVVDVSNPGAPSHAGKLADGDGGAELGNASRVFVRGDHAYVAAGGSAGALQIVDVSNPGSPSHAGKLSLNDPMGVFVRGDYAYVALDSGDALAVVDVRNPAEPRLVSTHALAVGGARRAHVSGHHAYVTQLDLVRDGFTQVARSALEVVDVSDPANPSSASTVYHDMDLGDTSGSGALLDSPRGVAVRGGRAYVAAFDSDALQVLDVSAATSPRAAGALAHDASAGVLLDGAAGLAVKGDCAYVAAFGSDALTMVDVSDPSGPAHAASVTESGALDGAFGVHVRGNRAYVASWNGDALEVIAVGRTRARIGDAVTVELDASEDISVSAFTVNGVAATGVTQVGSQLYATYTVQAGQPDAARVPYAVSATDRAGHATTVKGQLPLAVDATAPTIERLAYGGTAATLTLSEPVWSPAAPAAGDFAVTEDGSASSVSAVTVASSADAASATIALTMAAALDGAKVSVRYTPNAAVSQRPRDAAGNGLAAQTVAASRQATLSVTAPTIGGHVTGTGGSGATAIECGSGARTDCTAAVDSGSVLMLTATPDAGYVFGGWSGACTGRESTCSVTLNGDAGVTAAFGLARTLTVTAPGNGTVTGTDAGGVEVIACGTGCAATLIDGTTVTLVAAPASGYAFSSWGGACAAETTSSCALTMDADKSAGATFVIPVPGPVRNLSGSAIGSDVTLTWDAPDTGGTPTEYTVAGGGTVSISGTAATVTGLSAQTEYTFTVTANNAGGAGPGTDVKVTTEAAPGEVANLTGAPAGSTGALLSWDAPAAGGTASEYGVTGPGTVGAAGTAAAITGLSPETGYTWTVKAINSSGSSAGLDVTVTTLAAVPGAVGGVRVTAVGTDTASLAWSAPAQGGTPTGYTVTGGGMATVTGTAASITGLSDGTAYTFSVAASGAGDSGEAVPIRVRTGTPAAVSGAGASIAGLTDGGSYTFSVTGGNSAGTGEAATVGVTAGTPGAVGGLNVDARTASTVDLSWTAPSGGGTPTGYTLAGGGTRHALPGLRARVAGLAADTPYTFSVNAYNDAGSGTAASLDVTTASVEAAPGPVRELRIGSVSADAVQLSWAIPDTGGAPAVYAVGGGGAAAVTGTSASISGLAEDGTYTFSVTGSNAAGMSEAATVEATTGTPGTVRGLRLDGKTADAVNLSWLPPGGGGTPTRYSVTGGGTAAVDGTRARIAGLSFDTAYTFTVSAVNGAGAGAGTPIEVRTVDFMPMLPAMADRAATADVELNLVLPEADGGNPPLTYALSGLPGTLSFDTAMRTVSGTPTTEQGYTLTCTAADNDGDKAEATFTLTIEADEKPTLSVPDRAAAANKPMNLTLPEAAGGNAPLSYGLSGLPGTLTFDADKRTVSGTATEQTAYTLTYTATDRDGDKAEAAFTLTIEADAAPSLPDASDETGVEGHALSLILPEATGGNAPLGYELAGLPGTLTFSASTRTVSGTPGTGDVGAHALTYTVTDQDGDTDSEDFTLTIEADVDVELPSVSDKTGVEDFALSFVLGEATKGNAPLGYELDGLPQTLSFDADTRTVSGTPGAGDVDTHTLTYKATDRDGDLASAQFELEIQDDTEPAVTVEDRAVAPEEALNVTLPEATGGNAPLTYALTGLPGSLSFEASTRTLSGTPGTGDVGDHMLAYTVTDRDGDIVSAEFTLTVGAPPGTVENLEATSVGTDSVSLSWDAPSTGGAPTSYIVTGGGTTAVSGTAATISGLSGATAYTFSVRASNAAGSGDVSQVAVTTGTPGAVGNLSLTSVNATTVSISWNAPAGGGTPTSYTVTGGGTAVVSGTTATIGGLTDGSSYTFRVTAGNAAGTGSASEIAVTTGTPDAVSNPSPTSVGTTSVSLSWAVPATGGTPTSYTVTGGGTASVSGTTASITGLTDATAYTFSVTAGNAAGTGTVAQVAVTTGAPGPVNDLEASAQRGSTGVRLSWKTPTSGGTPTRYTVSRAGASDITVTGTARTISGLREETHYTWTVTADNAAGSGAGRSVSETTYANVAYPGPVRNLTASATGPYTASLDWDAPATGGTPTVYRVGCYETDPYSSGSATVTISGTAATVTGLRAQKKHNCYVYASNRGGSGDLRDAAFTTPAPKPDPVENLEGSATGATTVSLDWDAPEDCTPTGYTVSGSGTVAQSGTGAKVTGLACGTSYTWSVSAEYASGPSPSESVAVTTPWPSLNLSGSATDATTVTLDWDELSGCGTPAGYTVSGSGTVAQSGTGAKVTGLTCGTSYTWSVSAEYASGSSPSESVAVTTPWPSLNLSGSATGATTATLDWDEPSGCGTVTGYSVTGSGTITVSGTEASVTGLTANTAYTFSVTANTSAGTSPEENTDLTTPPNAVGNLRVMTLFQRGFTIAWDAPSGGATSYDVAGVGDTVNTTGTTVTYNGLSPGRTFTITVTANGAGGTSLPRTITANPGGSPGMTSGPPISVLP